MYICACVDVCLSAEMINAALHLQHQLKMHAGFRLAAEMINAVLLLQKQMDLKCLSSIHDAAVYTQPVSRESCASTSVLKRLELRLFITTYDVRENRHLSHGPSSTLNVEIKM